RQSFPQNLQGAIAKYIENHPGVVSQYGPRPPGAAPNPGADQPPPAGPVNGPPPPSPAGPADSFQGSPSVAAAQQEIGVAPGAGRDAATEQALSADKGLGDASGRVGGKLASMKGGLGSAAESGAGGMPGGGNGASPAGGAAATAAQAQ